MEERSKRGSKEIRSLCNSSGEKFREWLQWQRQEAGFDMGPETEQLKLLIYWIWMAIRKERNTLRLLNRTSRGLLVT